MLASAIGPKLETVSSRGFALDVVVMAEFCKCDVIHYSSFGWFRVAKRG